MSKKVKVGDKCGIEHYSPDVFCEIDGKKVVFEVETYANHSKITQDIIFSKILGADLLVIIFSNKNGRGKVRVGRAKSIKQRLCQHFPELSTLKILAFHANDLDDISNLTQKLRFDLNSLHHFDTQ